MKKLLTFNEFLNESRSKYDGISSNLTSNTFKAWIKGHKNKKSSIEYEESIEFEKLEFDLIATLNINKKFTGFEVLDSTGADGRDEDDEGDPQTPIIIIDFGINPDWLPGEWQMVYMHLADVMRHEMEHITQKGKSIGNYRMGKPDEDDTEIRNMINLGLLPKAQYHMLPKEVDSNLQGLRFSAKKRKESMLDSVNRYLDTQEDSGVINSKEREEILDVWRRRAKQIGGIPNF